MPLIFGQRSLGGSPLGSPDTIHTMLAFAVRHGIEPMIETFPMSKVNDALEKLRTGKPRYRIVLESDF
ncbi:MAG: hypothetical protein PVH43_05375 [Desulfobacterales bacterium]|jgi:uncharacterized zinc-type alcohol dehydrogenase-like protein